MMAAPLSSPTTDQSRDAWDTLAPRFDEFVTDKAITFAEHVLDQFPIGPGTRLLDIGCGTGAVSIPAARRGARVTAVDLAPTMVERLVARARAEGLDHVEGRVMDAQALDLPDDTFDLSASQNGVSLLPDLRTGLREVVRVTKPGGQVVIIAFGPPQQVEFLGFFMGALQAAAVPGIPLPPMDPPPLPMQLGDADRSCRELQGAGLTDVEVDTLTWDMLFTSGRHLWDTVTASNPIAVQLTAGLSAEQRTEVQQVLDGMLREHSGGTPHAALRAAMNVGIGTK
jgi:ubiquinone/menaquinone biosynthesis C-methylase UbiE